MSIIFEKQYFFKKEETFFFKGKLVLVQKIQIRKIGLNEGPKLFYSERN